MRNWFLLLVCLCMVSPSMANHLKGGWIQYKYIGPGAAANTSRYEITVRQYLDCGSNAGQRDASVFLGVFNSKTGAQVDNVTILLSGTDNPNKTTFSPCIASPPKVCYLIDYYIKQIDLPNNPDGYTLTVQRCCRIAGIVNVAGNSSSIGVSYTNTIPGVINEVDYSKNNSPVFAQKDTAIICFNSPFTFDFGATDADGDQITYSFCYGLVGGSAGAPAPNPPTGPPYIAVPYATSFPGTSPMGSSVTIDPVTGIISGIAPGITGQYVIAVCASEYRNGVLIGVTKKEIHVTVANCSISAAELNPSYITCNGTTLSFQNLSSNSTITSYFWDFGVAGITTDTSTSPTPTYDYLNSGKDSGTYTVKLVVASSSGCKDSATALVKVYPLLKTSFNIAGTCIINPFTFKDVSTSKYGTIVSRKWDFGDVNSTADTASAVDTAWTFSSPGTVQIKLKISNSFGCSDSLTKTLTILDKPFLNLPFKDTLICSIDTLPLIANIAGGVISWSPTAGANQNRILFSNTANPLVYPRDTTRYVVTVNDKGCINRDTVVVNVLQFISVDAGKDTAICKTDPIRLATISEALSYLWTSSSGEVVDPIKNPIVQPLVNTSYYVLANLGKCQAKDSVRVKVVPYPYAYVGEDTTICFGNRVKLSAIASGSYFSWSPTVSLINERTLSPLAGPSYTTMYILTISDTTGCPKAVNDTIIINVLPPINAYAGRDTTIVPGLAFQLQASGGTRYFWSPPTGLSAVNIANPLVTLGRGIDSIIYRVSVFNGPCVKNDYVTIRVSQVGPDILVPSGFTPNGDGKNDLARPATPGIAQLKYFTIFNRLGEAVFTTSTIGSGWDGMFKGKAQPAGTYVYQAEGVDYEGTTIFRKGTIVLIR
ncbi:MAG: PKD domain-containing protein [Bacteroidetes bacterium]|nr:PKD domain-containing protein [Bacteroidota bacterium]